MSDDLTSLNWLSKLSAADHTITDDSSSSHTRRVYVNTIPDPASASLHGQAFQTKQSATRQRGSNHAARSRAPYHPVDRDIQPVVERKYPRPACSYSCLIAMALKACLTGCLPVSEIYRFIEQEYPYYKTAPDGWKNSIRHNLSLNASFCKAERPDGLQMKKGCYWMINPERLHVVESEIEKFLRKEGRSLVENGEQQPCSSVCPPCYATPEPLRMRSRSTFPARHLFHQSLSSPFSPSFANCQKMNSIFGITMEPFTGSSIAPPSYTLTQSRYGLPLTGASGALQELFGDSLTPSVLSYMDDSGVTFLHTTSSPSTFPDPLCDQFGELGQPKDPVLEYSVTPVSSSHSSFSCSSTSSQSSLKAVDKILTNILSSQLAIPGLNVGETAIPRQPPTNLDELLSRLVEERLRGSYHDNPLEQRSPIAPHEQLQGRMVPTSSAFGPVVMSNHQLPSYLCDGDSDMEDDCDDDYSVMEEEEEEEEEEGRLVRGKFVAHSSAGAENTFTLNENQEEDEDSMEPILDDGVIGEPTDTLSMDVGNILGNLYKEPQLTGPRASSSYPAFQTGANLDGVMKRTPSTPARQ